ncbi:MAG: response regulator [Oscillospiraceae bacterium]
MNILVVDDQFDVVEGLICGIDWSDIGEVYSAYSAHDARVIMRQTMIDVLVTDIEMPMQSGIELVKWAKSRYPATECIFLSSHAEFSYAKEALQLGSFDYIVQPAPYEDIRAAIVKATQKIKSDAHLQKVYEYGVYWQENQETALDNCMRNYLMDDSKYIDKFIQDMQKLNIPIKMDTLFFPILIHLMQDEDSKADLEGAVLKYALKNFICEILEPYGGQIIFVQLDQLNYLALLSGASIDSSTQQNFIQHLEFFMGVCKKHLAYNVACYIGDCFNISMFRTTYQLLCQMRQDNVACYSKVFTKKSQTQTKKYIYAFPNIEYWETLIANGNAVLVRVQATEYLKRQKQSGMMTAEFLAKFHQDFIQMFFNAIKDLNLTYHDIFFEEYSFEDYIGAYTSLDKMFELVEFTMKYLQAKITEPTSEQSSIDKAITYINQNIEQNFSRAQVAEAVYLNPEYLSRLFKKEKGISLNDFISTRKMEIAQSLLSNTNIPIYLVASKVGYYNFSYFSQVFKKFCGVTPQEYRQQYNEKANQ